MNFRPSGNPSRLTNRPVSNQILLIRPGNRVRPRSYTQVSNLNTNINHNDKFSVPIQVRERLGFMESKSIYFGKERPKLYPTSRRCQQYINDKCQKRLHSQTSLTYFNGKKHYLNMPSVTKLRAFESRKQMTTSNNADEMAKQMALVKRFLTPFLICNGTEHNEIILKNNACPKRNKTVARAYETRHCCPSRYRYSVNQKQTKDNRELIYHKNTRGLINKNSPKTGFVDSVRRRPITKLIIKTSLTRVDNKDLGKRYSGYVSRDKFRGKLKSSKVLVKENQRKEEYLLEIKRKQSEWLKLHRRKQITTAMDCVDKIIGRIYSKNSDFTRSCKISPCSISRHYVVDDNDLCSTSLNYSFIALDPFKPQKAIVTQSKYLEKLSVIRCTPFLFLVHSPTMIHALVPLDSFNIYEKRCEHTFSQLFVSICIEFVDIFHSINVLTNFSYLSLKVGPLNHQEDLHYNLSKLQSKSVQILDLNALCWNDSLPDSWDDISTTSSSSSTGTMALQDYRNTSLDSLCKTEDVYGSDFETEKIEYVGKDFDYDKFDYEIAKGDYYESDVDSTVTAQFSIDEYEMFMYELSAEMFTLYEEEEIDFENESLELCQACFTIMANICISTRTWRRNYHCSPSFVHEGLDGYGMKTFLDSCESFVIVDSTNVVQVPSLFTFNNRNVCIVSEKIVY